jgi:gliding motility-associated-like protein
MQSQCFDCAKNIGGWNDDWVNDLKKTNDGIILTYSSGNFITSGIYKFDFNCNLIWKKEFGHTEAQKIATDNQGNIYILFDYPLGSNPDLGPFNVDGLSLYPGLTLYKFDLNGNIIWNKKIGFTMEPMLNIFYFEDNLYITGSFFNYININNQILLSDPAYYGRAYIAKFDTNGNLLDAQKYGSNDDFFQSSEMDSSGNIYFARTNPNYTNSNIDKINKNLQTIWTKQISNNANIANTHSYRPTSLHYNSTNNKLYLWGCFDRTVNILGNIFNTNSANNGILQSILTEFNVSDGNLERFRQFNNNSLLEYPGRANQYPYTLNRVFMSEKNNELFIFSSFSGTISFPNTTITSTPYYDNNAYNSEELVLFKIKLDDFNPEFILKSTGKSSLNYLVRDCPSPILLSGNDLYLTSSFQSSPITINNAIINNNSGNNSADVMLYKYKLDSASNNGEIITDNTCLNELTKLSLNGNFDSIIWNFGDITSINNTSNINNPQHQFSSSGNFHITATVVCGSNTQIIEKDIVITNHPTINSISTITNCETISGTGICSQFDTSNINSLLIGNQQNVTIEYRNSNGSLLPSPLPNPFTNTNVGGDIITAKAFFTNNNTCFSETTIEFRTSLKPLSPTTPSPQTFCLEQNATLNSIVITGINIKWYDTLTNGNLFPNTTLLQNGITYFASQTINGCESERIPVLVNIQNTATPTTISLQTFCASQNPTLNTISVTGTAIKWYDSIIAGNILANTTPLENGKTYYATQTLNGCESPTRATITVALISTLPANNYEELFCDDLNDGTEMVDLSSYNSSIISNTTNYNFSFYSSILGAENETASNKITNFSSYKLALGDNKIYVRINSNTPCYAIVELKLTLISKPKITIEDLVPICENNSITIDAGAGFDHYLWSNGATTQSINVSDPGSFSITLTNDYGSISCSSTKNFTVKQSSKAAINTIETKDWTDNDNVITVFATGNGVYEYSIDGENYQDSSVFSGLVSGKYIVQVRDKNNCGIIKSNEIYLLMFPKFFTPNGDGYNDTWKIKFSDIEEGLTVKIFDRYGKLIKNLASNTSEWNGTFNGAELPSSDYWFIVTRANGLEYKGHFSLKR